MQDTRRMVSWLRYQVGVSGKTGIVPWARLGEENGVYVLCENLIL